MGGRGRRSMVRSRLRSRGAGKSGRSSFFLWDGLQRRSMNEDVTFVDSEEGRIPNITHPQSPFFPPMYQSVFICTNRHNPRPRDSVG